MKRKEIGLEIKLEEGEKITSFQLSDEAASYMDSIVGKTHIDYIIEFLGPKENFEIAMKAMNTCMHQSLPENITDNCGFCKKGSRDQADQACIKYALQMQFTYMIAANEFISLVFRNKHIYENKVELQKLTISFFDCFNFIRGKGLMYFDLDKLSRYALDANFKSLSELFKNSKTLKSLQVINDTLDILNDEEIENKVLQKEDGNYIELQKDFFQNKQRYYKEKLFLEEKDSQQLQSVKSKGKRQISKSPSVPRYALYYYYLQQSKDFPHFENHPQGKVIAIEELIKNESLNTSQKYFQLKYNKIANHKTNRVALNQVRNIDFVANTMLKEFPKAQKMALIELKEAETKNR